jgi:hypothetical protein
LHDVDRFDLIFDVKAVVTLFANALSKHGTRGSARWDDTLLDALRKKNALMQAQFAVREDLDAITRSLSSMRRYQEDYDCLRPAHSPDAVQVNSVSLPPPPSPPPARAEWLNPEDEFLLACRVTAGEARRSW